MNSLAMSASANLIFNISLHKFLCKFTATNKKNQLLPPAILRVISSWSKKCVRHM